MHREYAICVRVGASNADWNLSKLSPGTLVARENQSTILVVRFNDNTSAMENQHGPVSCVTRYRKKSPSELRRDVRPACEDKTAAACTATGE